MCYWFRGPDRPEPEQEEDLLLQEQETQQEENTEPDNDLEELSQLPETNQHLEREVQRLMRQLETTEAQLTETAELLAISLRHAGKHYPEAQFAKHIAEQVEPTAQPYPTR